MAARLNIYQRDRRRRKRGLKLENLEGRTSVTSMAGSRAIGFGRHHKFKRAY